MDTPLWRPACRTHRCPQGHACAGGADPKTSSHRNSCPTFQRCIFQTIHHSTGCNSKQLEGMLLSMARRWDPSVPSVRPRIRDISRETRIYENESVCERETETDRQKERDRAREICTKSSMGFTTGDGNCHSLLFSFRGLRDIST